MDKSGLQHSRGRITGAQRETWVWMVGAPPISPLQWRQGSVVYWKLEHRMRNELSCWVALWSTAGHLLCKIKGVDWMLFRALFSSTFLGACDISPFQFALAVSLPTSISNLRAHSLHKALPCLPHPVSITSGQPPDCHIPYIRKTVRPSIPAGMVELWMLSQQGSLCVLDFWWGFLFSKAYFPSASPFICSTFVTWILWLG